MWWVAGDGTVLRIEFRRSGTVREFTRVLRTVDRAYAAALHLEGLRITARDWQHQEQVRIVARRVVPVVVESSVAYEEAILRDVDFRHIIPTAPQRQPPPQYDRDDPAPSNRDVKLYGIFDELPRTLEASPLRISKISIASPGLADLLGMGRAVEAVVEAIDQAKTREARIAQERARARQEIARALQEEAKADLLRVKVVKEAVALMREHGATQSEVSDVVNEAATQLLAPATQLHKETIKEDALVSKYSVAYVPQ